MPPCPSPSSRPQLRHVAVDDPHLDTGIADPFVRALQSLVGVVHASDLPATLRQLDTPDSASSTDVERRPEGWLASALLSFEQLRDLLDEPRMPLGVLPGVEAEPVGELVVHLCLLNVCRGRRNVV